jgi:hypothetical protein
MALSANTRNEPKARNPLLRRETLNDCEERAFDRFAAQHDRFRVGAMLRDRLEQMSLESAEATPPRRSTVERRSPQTLRPERTAVRRGRC